MDTNLNLVTRKKINLRVIVVTAMFSTMAYVLAFLRFPLPLFPSFAKIDLSDLPAMIGSFTYGPLCGGLIVLIKNLLQLISSDSAGVGELANFSMGIALVATAGFVYKKRPTKKGALLGCLIGCVALGIMSVIMNYFVLIPIYSKFMNMDQLIESFHRVMPFIKTKLDMVLLNALPFSVMRAVIISIITMLLYSKLNVVIRRGEEFL